MKKLWLRSIFVIIILLTVVFAFAACDDDADDINTTENNGEYISTNRYFDIKNLYFNADYVGEEGYTEKGFLLYDELTFNRISISSEVLRRDNYYVEYILYLENEKEGEKIFEEIYRTEDNTVSYIFKKTGLYKLIVTGTVKNKVSDIFYFNVTNQKNLPDKVDFVISSNGEIVTAAEAGKEFSIKAELYRNGQIIKEDEENYTAYWKNAEENQVEFSTGKLDNLAEDSEKKYVFVISNKKNTGMLSETNFEFSLPIKNNLDKIEIEYGWDTQKTVDIDINKSKSFNFKDKISASYIFNNGEQKKIDINYGTPKVGDAVVLIKYNEREEYTEYNNDTINNNGYYQIVDKDAYNFNLSDVGKAKIKVGICQAKTDDIYNYFIYDDIEESKTEINITAGEITQFEIKTFSGKYRKFASAPLESDSFVEYSGGEIENDTVECYINSQRVNFDREYLEFELNINENASCKEYFIDAATDEFLINYSKDEDGAMSAKVYPLKSGTFELKFKSVLVDDVQAGITLIVTNPLAGYSIVPIKDNMTITYVEGNGDYNAFKKAMSEYIMIDNIYYNEQDKERDTHIIGDDDSLKVFFANSGGLVFSIELNEFNYGQLKYKQNIYNIDFRLENSATGFTARMENTLSVFIIPDFGLKINGEKSKLTELPVTYTQYEQKAGDTIIYEVVHIAVYTVNEKPQTVEFYDFADLSSAEQELFFIDFNEKEDEKQIVIKMSIKNSNNNNLVIYGFIIDYGQEG